MATSIRTNAQAQGSPERIERYLERLRSAIRRAYKSKPIRLEAGQERSIRTHQRKLLPPRDGTFEFRGILPLPQFVLATGGTISIAVALPRNTQRFSVDLLDWTRNFSPQAFGKDSGLPTVGGHSLVACDGLGRGQR